MAICRSNERWEVHVYKRHKRPRWERSRRWRGLMSYSEARRVIIACERLGKRARMVEVPVA
jgi:hypothetical protein